MHEFTGFFVRPQVPRTEPLPAGAVWRDITTPFVGVGVRLSRLDETLLPPSEVVELARQLGFNVAICWVYLTYVCWGGDIDFVYGLGSNCGVGFRPIKEDARDAVEASYTGLMEQFGLPAEVVLQFEPFKRSYWGED